MADSITKTLADSLLDYGLSDGVVSERDAQELAEFIVGCHPIIAAAQELLEALQSAEQALNKIRVCCHHTAWDATGPAVIAARAAIEKATGSAQ